MSLVGLDLHVTDRVGVHHLAVGRLRQEFGSNLKKKVPLCSESQVVALEVADGDHGAAIEVTLASSDANLHFE
jgi:hypothetical protein